MRPGSTAVRSALARPARGEPAKAAPHLKPLPGVRAVLWNVYGTLLAIPFGELLFEHPTEFVMTMALEKTIAEFKMWGSMSRKPVRRPNTCGTCTRAAFDEQRLAPSPGEKYPEILAERVWESVLKKLFAKDYNFDAGFYGSLNEYSRKIAYFFHASLQGTAAYPGADHALRAVADAGLVQGLCGNGQCFTMLQVQAASRSLDPGLRADELFSEPLRALSHAINARKPSERLFQHALDALAEQGIEPHEVLHVGSALARDIVPAKKLGHAHRPLRRRSRFARCPTRSTQRKGREAQCSLDGSGADCGSYRFRLRSEPHMPPEAHFDLSTLDQTKVIADHDAIRKVNPQRFEMEQLDGILFFDRERALMIGYKDVRPDEFWVRGHMPGMPLMPGVIMCESAARAVLLFFRDAGRDRTGSHARLRRYGRCSLPRSSPARRSVDSRVQGRAVASATFDLRRARLRRRGDGVSRQSDRRAARRPAAGSVTVRRPKCWPLEVLAPYILDLQRPQREPGPSIAIDFRAVFGDSRPIELEIGCGKGGFLVAAAGRAPVAQLPRPRNRSALYFYIASRLAKRNLRQRRSRLRRRQGFLCATALPRIRSRRSTSISPIPGGRSGTTERRLWSPDFAAECVRIFAEPATCMSPPTSPSMPRRFAICSTNQPQLSANKATNSMASRARKKR